MDPTGSPTPTSGPLGGLIDGLTGGGGGGPGGGKDGTGKPSVPVVSELLDGVGELLDDVLIDPLTGQRSD